MGGVSHKDFLSAISSPVIVISVVMSKRKKDPQ
jgi:hypothetical protein